MNSTSILKKLFRSLASRRRLARHYAQRTLAQDAGEHWITVNAGSKTGGEGGGAHVLLDGEGRVVAGMGGKFKGQHIDRIERKKFINENAYQRLQAQKAKGEAPKAEAPKAEAPKAEAPKAEAPKPNVEGIANSMYDKLKEQAKTPVQKEYLDKIMEKVKNDLARERDRALILNRDQEPWEKVQNLADDISRRIVNTIRNIGITGALPNAKPKAEAPELKGMSYPGAKVAQGQGGRYEVAFGSMPSYELRSDMKRNGVKWDATKKVWYSNDSTRLNEILSKHLAPKAEGAKTLQDVLGEADTKKFNYAEHNGKAYVRKDRYSSWSEIDPARGTAWGASKDDIARAKSDAEAGIPSKDYDRYKEVAKNRHEAFYGKGNTQSVSNQYFKYKPVLDNDNIIIATNNITSYKDKYGNPKYMLVTGANQAVYLNPEDFRRVTISTPTNVSRTNLVKLSRGRFKPYTFKNPFKGFSVDKEYSFDDLLAIAKRQNDGRTVSD